MSPVLAVLLLLALLVGARPAAAGSEPLSKPQQRCVNGVNRAFAAALADVNAAALACREAAAAGAAVSFSACRAGYDLAPSLARTERAQARRCEAAGASALPTFAYLGDASAVTEAASSHGFAAYQELLGRPAAVATPADPEGVRCQKGVLAAFGGYLATLASETNRLKKVSLKGRDGSPATIAPELAADLTTAPGSAASAAALARLVRKTEAKCGGQDLAARFGGACASDAADAASFAACAGALARCRFCLALDAADALAIDCAGYSGLPACPVAVCGNGLQEAGEACDDGNTDAGDGCRADCSEELCGDGVVDPNEACDGGAAGEEGCLGDCTLAGQAPPDASPNAPLVVPLGATAEVGELVSYPFGDRIDELAYSVSGLAADPDAQNGRAQLVVSLSCSGIGTEHVVVESGSLRAHCGEIVFDRTVTATNASGTIEVEAVAGDGTYVEWTLVGTATPLAPPAPVAPPDDATNGPLALDGDGAASVTNWVSFPGGDTLDTVLYAVTLSDNPGARSRLVASASCFGTGTQHLRFRTGGETFTCGQTLIDRVVTPGDDDGAVEIEAVGGTGTYVQWVLTGATTQLPLEAPRDAIFNAPLVVPLGGGAVDVRDFVSYPGGDRIDLVSYSVTGLVADRRLPNSSGRLVLGVSCFGSGTADVEIHVGDRVFPCGTTILDRTVTTASNTGTIAIVAVAGEFTFVNWLLQGTATPAR